MAKIIYKYKFDEQFNPKFINGAVGGINSQGEIIINFFLERNSLPKHQTFEMDESTGLSELTETNPPDFEESLIRYVENGIIMNYKTAKELHRWLGEHIRNLETIDKD